MKFSNMGIIKIVNIVNEKTIAALSLKSAIKNKIKLKTIKNKKRITRSRFIRTS